MKMHSYSFYNGHLSETERRLQALDEPSTASKAPAYLYPSAGHTPSLEEREKKAADESSELAQLREDLAIELTSPMGSVTYPKNLTWGNYVDYLFCPTLCYELEYPRTSGIVWSELGYKVLATFGVIFLLTVTSEEFILPVMIESAYRLESVTSLSETGLIIAESISLLLWPFMITFLLVFLVIFEYVLGAFAEITCEPSCPTALCIKLIYLRLRGQALLLRLVELNRLARILSRVEHPRTSLLSSPRLQCLKAAYRASDGYSDHFSHLSHWSRDRDGLYYQKDPWIRLFGSDEPTPNRNAATYEMGKGQATVE
jgi:hypothetical protein